jgi:ABC-2 type transport system ATP-binding protein
MRLITGQLRPDIGEVAVGGEDPWSVAGKRQVGYCPDVDVFYEEMSGRQFLLTMARLCGWSARASRERTEAVLARVGMTESADRCVRGYSKGMRQRIKLAQALLHDPPLLVLDEPLSGIDPVGRVEFLRLFRELAAQGKCLLVSSHELEELEKLTDHIVIMSRGRIAVVGTVAQIRDRLDQHPLTVRLGVASPRADGRQTAAMLLRLDDVVGVDVEDQANDSLVSLLLRVRRPRQFFHDLGRLVVEECLDVRNLEAVDDSAHAVLGYLLGARG